MDSSNKTYAIRLATESDIPAVLAIEKELYTDPWTEISFLSCLTDNTDFFIIEETDGITEAVICGFAVLDRSLGIEAELHNIAIATSHQGKGLAKMLMDAIIESTITNGADKIMLEVRASNTPAISLYTKYGFEKVGLRPAYYRHPTETAILMDLDLDKKITQKQVGETEVN